MDKVKVQRAILQFAIERIREGRSFVALQENDLEALSWISGQRRGQGRGRTTH